MSRRFTNLELVSAFNAGLAAAGYLNFESSLADNQAINIRATDTVGGINIEAGTGGISATTTNAILFNAGAQAEFLTSNGNLVFGSAGTVNIDGTGGINMGTDDEDGSINIGTSTSNRYINIGNANLSSYVNVHGGTGGVSLDALGPVSIDATGASCNFTLATDGDGQDLVIAITGDTDSSIVLNSSGTASDALRIITAGGIDADATGTINLSTASSVGGAITLDASFGGGGITISSGSQGIAINTGGGLIGIGHWSGGDIQIGTAAVARMVTLGNTTGTTAVLIESGSGGINVGGNSSGGEVHIANGSVARTMIMGNTVGGSRTFHRKGTGGFFRTQPAHVALSDSDASISVGSLMSEILSGTPTADRTLTLPTAATVVSSISGIAVDDAFDFHIINKGTTDDAEFILAMGTGGTMEGNPNVSPSDNTTNSYKNNGSSHFRLRMTNVTSSSEAYTVYRLG